jgi:hypothetical protein
MASKAYLKLLEEKAIMTVNTFAPNPLINQPHPSVDEMVDFIMQRLAQHKVRGYSREYVRQLVIENEI